MKKNNNNTVWHNGYVTTGDRNRLNKHGAGIIWFTGLSASGKSTIAHNVEKRLFQKGIRAYVFDGDNVRHGLNSDLGFSDQDREENIRRIVEVARLFVDAGIVVLAAFITPLGKQREFIRKSFGDMKFMEVYVKCDIEECMRRDPKGLYEKARAGIIENYTGVSSPFEEPLDSDLVIDTREMDIDDAVVKVLDFLRENNFLNPPT